MTTTPPHQKLQRAVARVSPLCIGLDPSPALIKDWELEDNPEGLQRFVDLFLDASKTAVSIVKPQVAFFERHGWQGMKILHEFIQRAQEQRQFIIADAKRSDIPNTMHAYADAWLSNSPNAFHADALTLTPWMGFDSLLPAVQLARNEDKTIFVVAAASNPEAQSVQSLALSKNVLKNVRTHRLGAVIGATTPTHVIRELLPLIPESPVLIPGIGAQGASLQSVAHAFQSPHSASQSPYPTALPVVARSLLQQGPLALHDAASRLGQEVINFFSHNTPRI